MNDDRLIDLESKIAHQEMALEELQKTVFEQTSLLVKLEKNLKLVKDRLEALSRGDGAPPVSEKPPHY